MASSVDAKDASSDFTAASGGSLALREWRSGAFVVAISTIGFMVAVLHTVTLGTLLTAIQAETKWNSTQVTSGMLVLSAVAIVLSPVQGRLVDKYGVRYVGLAGMALYCSGIALLSTTGPEVWHWLALWLLVAIGQVCVCPTLWSAGVVKRFRASRGLAIATVLCGGGLGMIVWPAITEFLLQNYGWRNAYLVLGAVSGLVMLPLMAIGYRDAPASEDLGPEANRKDGLGIAQGLLSTRFARLVFATLLMNSCLLALFVHFVPIVTQGGLTRADAIAIVSLIGVFSICGRLVSGFLLDRADARLIASVSFLLPIGGALALYFGQDNVTLALVGAMLVGLAFGSEIDVVAYLTSRYFGMKHYGFFFGLMVCAMLVGSGVGPALASASRDGFGDYRVFLVGCIAAFVVSAASAASLGRYPRFE